MRQLSLLPNQGDSLPESVVVKGDDSNFYKVCLKNLSCTCGADSREPCSHLDIAMDVHLNRGRKHRFEIMSLYHKLVRKSDQPAAYRAALLFSKIHKKGLSRVSEYSKSICFEETRSLLFYRQAMLGEIEPRDQIRNLVRLRKKHELDIFIKERVLENWAQGLRRYNEKPEKWTLRHIRSRLQRFSDLAELYTLVFAWRADRSLTPVFIEELNQRAVREKNKRLLDYLKLKPDGHYPITVALELCLDFWDAQAEEMEPVEPMGEFYLPDSNFFDWVFDSHSWRGQRLLRLGWPVHPNQPQPPGIDLRWSGMIQGVAYRFNAYEQFGFVRDRSSDEEVSWEKVFISDELQQDIENLEYHFYSKFINSTRSRHPNK